MPTMTNQVTKTALVLGARAGSGNIGEAIATALASHTTVTAESCVQWRALLDDSYDHDFEQYVVPEMDDGIDALVVTLGATMVQPFEDGMPSEITEVVRACLTLPLLVAQQYVQVRDQLGGKVVFIGSYAHDHPITYGTAYCAAKAGLAMATRTLAWELGPRGYDFHIVHPYHTPGTPMWEFVQEQVVSNRGMTPAEAEAYAMKDARRGKLLTPEEIAQVVQMLLTLDAAEWLSGSGLNLYGGVR